MLDRHSGADPASSRGFEKSAVQLMGFQTNNLGLYAKSFWRMIVSIGSTSKAASRKAVRDSASDRLRSAKID
jgi:hypothetical protein